MQHDQKSLTGQVGNEGLIRAEIDRITKALDTHVGLAVQNKDQEYFLKVITYLQEYRFTVMAPWGGSKKFNRKELSVALMEIERKYREQFSAFVTSQQLQPAAPREQTKSESPIIERFPAPPDRPHRKVEFPRQTLSPEAHIEQASSEQVPKVAEFVLDLLTPGRDREAVLGDLEEQFSKRVKKYGVRGAKVWLYKDVLASMLPLLRRLLAISLGEWIRRHIS
jgi:hypothetical protein